MKQRRSNSKNSAFSLVISLLIGGCFCTVGLNVIHASLFHVEGNHEQSFREKHIKVAESLVRYHPVAQPRSNHTQKLAGLSCEPYGGPEDPSEVVFWSDMPQDADFVSPLRRPDGVEQYLLFEPDGGGWNNIRMSMETVLAMAHAMGRTLVLPPEQRMYLLGALSQQAQKKAFSFMDFFPMEAIASEHRGLNVITMDEFLEREGLSGRLQDSSTGELSFPPNNRTDWNGMNSQVNTELNPWIRSIAIMPEWNPDKCLAAFPKSRDPEDSLSLQSLLRLALDDELTPPDPATYIGKPTKVDAAPLDRLKEALAGRDQLCIYDTTMQEAPVVHFHGKKGMGARLLVHFYAFLFFDDWQQDLWMKRFVRDHVRYIDEIQCGAAKITQAIRERARTLSGDMRNNINGDFDTFHIRRGDFQYKKTRISAQEIDDISKEILTVGSTVYVATDERDKSFFAPLAKKYDLLFLDDFLDLIPDTNTNYYGMIDQLVAAKGRIFFGCWFSTFTGYINRIRGYYSVQQQLPGYEDGVTKSYYYAMADNKMKMREYYPVKKAFYAREFPISWRNINIGAGVDPTKGQKKGAAS